MKKLLTLAVVACMATFAQALSLDWSANLGDTGTSWTTSATDAIYWSATGSNVNDLVKAIIDNDTTVYAAVADASFSGDVVGTAFKGGITIDGTPATSGTYFMVFKASDVYYVSSFNAPSALEGYWYEVGQTPTYTQQGSDFTKVVPEPTVLALLALGVAGVALRRRRMA